MSEDGESVNVGGMKWFPKGDYLRLNIRDINFSKKLRGRKASLGMDSKIPENVTRRDCVGKVAELFDPLGKIAPIIAGMKIDMNQLTTRKLDWDDRIPDDLKKIWVDNFEMIQELRDVTFNRAIVPKNAVNLSIETLDTADASTQIICVAIYARFQLNNGEYSCQLVFARTKIVPKEMSMPRAELLAATLNSTTGHMVRISFGEYFRRPLKLTDSQIVMHWINSSRSELKLWVRNRVIEINRLTELTQWRYIKSKDMIADLATRKGVKVTDILQYSEWIKGKPWMNWHESHFPTKTVKEIILSNTEKNECIIECSNPRLVDITTEGSSTSIHRGYFPGRVVPNEVKSRYEFSQYLIDPNRFRLRKVIRILGLVYLFVNNFCEKYGIKNRVPDHSRVKSSHLPDNFQCMRDRYLVTTGTMGENDPFSCPRGKVVCLSDDNKVCNDVFLSKSYP